MVFASAFQPFFAFLGGTEMMVLGGIIILLFGGSKLPKLARSLGESFVEFKKGVKGEDSDKLPGSEEKRQLPKDGDDR